MKTKKMVGSGGGKTDLNSWDSNPKKNFYILFLATRKPIKNLKDLSSGDIKPIRYVNLSFCGGARYWLSHNTLRETFAGDFVKALIEGLFPKEIPAVNIKKEIERGAKKNLDE